MRLFLEMVCTLEARSCRPYLVALPQNSFTKIWLIRCATNVNKKTLKGSQKL